MSFLDGYQADLALSALRDADKGLEAARVYLSDAGRVPGLDTRVSRLRSAVHNLRNEVIMLRKRKWEG